MHKNPRIDEFYALQKRSLKDFEVLKFGWDYLD